MSKGKSQRLKIGEQRSETLRAKIWSPNITVRGQIKRKQSLPPKKGRKMKGRIYQRNLKKKVF